jgi:hypothetical protein
MKKLSVKAFLRRRMAERGLYLPSWWLQKKPNPWPAKAKAR